MNERASERMNERVNGLMARQKATNYPENNKRMKGKNCEKARSESVKNHLLFIYLTSEKGRPGGESRELVNAV